MKPKFNNELSDCAIIHCTPVDDAVLGFQVPPPQVFGGGHGDNPPPGPAGYTHTYMVLDKNGL